uniref:Secreted protein n=1 Tax=Streptomyces sp. NBC_01393 TaxID=2903851 RepID=A0AAU3IEJ7_9ACTN
MTTDHISGLWGDLLHRTFPAALALAALVLITGCSGDDTGAASGTDGRQAPGTSAGQQLPDSSDATDPDASDTQEGQNQGYADPVDQCTNAIMVTMDGSVPSECEGLTPAQESQVAANLELLADAQKKGNEMLLDSIG